MRARPARAIAMPANVLKFTTLASARRVTAGLSMASVSPLRVLRSMARPHEEVLIRWHVDLDRGLSGRGRVRGRVIGVSRRSWDGGDIHAYDIARWREQCYWRERSVHYADPVPGCLGGRGSR